MPDRLNSHCQPVPSTPGFRPQVGRQQACFQLSMMALQGPSQARVLYLQMAIHVPGLIPMPSRSWSESTSIFSSGVVARPPVLRGQGRGNNSATTSF